MSWFSRTEDYSIEDSGFYGEPTIIYGSTDDDSSSSSSSTSTGGGPFDDFQNEYVSYCCTQHTR